MRLGPLLQSLGLGACIVSPFLGHLPQLPPWAPLPLLAFAGLLLGGPFAAAWGGGVLGVLRVSAAAALILALPVLPHAVLAHAPPAARFAPLVLGFLLHFFLRNAGRYLYSGRRLPDLEGEPRRVAAEVLERAGLRPRALLSGPFAAYNAGVAGLRDVVVIVDRRAARELPLEDLAAVVAHEAGHVRRGDPFLLLAFPSLALAAAALACSARPDAFVPVAVALVLASFPLFSQALELRADGFGGAVAGTGSMARALERIEADLPAAVRRTHARPWVAAAVGHPPAAVRSARLRGERAPVRSAWLAAAALFGALGLLPAVLVALDPDLDFDRLLAAAAPVPLWTAAVWIARLRAYQSSFRSSLGATGLSPDVWVLLLWILSIAGIAWLRRGSPAQGAWMLLSTFVFGFAYVVARVCRRPAAGSLEALPRALRARVVEILSAAIEDRTDDAAKAVASLAPDEAAQPWARFAKGTAAMLAARAAEARADLDAAADADARFLQPRINLAILHLAGAEPEAGLKRTEEACAIAPADPIAWVLRGETLAEAGRRGEAREAFERVLALKPGEVGALAGLAQLRMDEDAPEAEQAAALEAARAAGPGRPSVLLALARREHRHGRAAEAAAALASALAALSPPELRPYRPLYEARARRWGLGS